MTDLTTTHLKCLLEQATPGPWEAKDSDCITSQHGEVLWNTDQAVDWNKNDHDVNLAAAAPEIAQDNLRMRQELKEICAIWESASVNPDRTSAEQILAAQVVSHIDSVLGETDE